LQGNLDQDEGRQISPLVEKVDKTEEEIATTRILQRNAVHFTGQDGVPLLAQTTLLR